MLASASNYNTTALALRTLMMLTGDHPRRGTCLFDGVRLSIWGFRVRVRNRAYPERAGLRIALHTFRRTFDRTATSPSDYDSHRCDAGVRPLECHPALCHVTIQIPRGIVANTDDHLLAADDRERLHNSLVSSLTR